MQRTTLYIDKKVCLICTHLVGELGKKTKSCTFKKGNAKCPAHGLKIEVGVNADQAVEDLYVAIQSGDVASVIAVLTEAQSNEKISATLITDLQERLFEVAAQSEEELLAEEELSEGDAEEADADSEDDADDEDVDA